MSERRAFFRELGSVAREAARAATPDPPPEDPPARPADDPTALTDAELERYSRQLVLPEWSEAAQVALRAASVLVVGAGALRAPGAPHLAGAGGGPARTADADG